MKLLSILPFVALAIAGPLDFSGQAPLAVEDSFDLDLNERRLIQLEGHDPLWMSERDKARINLKAQGIKFFDITDTQELHFTASPAMNTQRTYPAPNSTEKVRPILKTLSSDGPKKNLEKFTSFRTRHYRSDTGKQSQQWLLSKISEITAEYAGQAMKDRVLIHEYNHPWGQNSIVQIARIQGSSTTDDGVVIISAHQDSTNLWPFLPAPGADGMQFTPDILYVDIDQSFPEDDGSGSVTILESYRALIAADFQPVNSVEFHWYSAEEGGLLGSQAVAKSYQADGVNVIAMSQFDMTAWVKRGTNEEVGVITDYTDPALTNFNKQLIETYLDIPFVETKCGYACSDHASWGKAGYPSVFTIGALISSGLLKPTSFLFNAESSFENSNKNIHSTNDRIDISDEFSFSHMLEFSKLAVAFAVELGGWTK
ncbi:hypothetical protein D9758_001231 [Tetrapyrgos nigripes]|uniref:Peptide hydrolase n=1 Tax=Tetrapyrgos nigripes TaxID=182062 RepID=A0A8H5LUF1_9AGAR|nr:hypothetical protein D9758_001231 [Tetrapyrgos nigripes]